MTYDYKAHIDFGDETSRAFEVRTLRDENAFLRARVRELQEDNRELLRELRDLQAEFNEYVYRVRDE